MNKGIIEPARADSIINRIQKIYLVLTCLIAVATIIKVFDNATGPSEIGPVAALFGLLICTTIYLGLKYRKNWVIPMLLIFSAASLFNSFLGTLELAKDMGSLARKFFDIIYFLFSAYQLYFFSRKEVKTLFQYKGIVIF